MGITLALAAVCGRMTSNSEVETSPAHATGPEAGIWEVQWTDSRRLALDGKQLRSSLP